MPLNDKRQAAKKFVEYWTFQRGSEKGEDQRFWNMLLRDVLGMEDVEQRAQPQVPVQMKGTTKFLDLWIPETKVLVEHKSRGIRLDAPQSGHGGKTPYEQAVEYDNARPFDEKARWIVTCNFDEFRIYDRAKPLAPPLKVRLGDLPKEAHRLAFLVNPTEKAVDRELEISVQAGRIVGEIYDALLGQYDNKRTDLLTPNGVRDGRAARPAPPRANTGGSRSCATEGEADAQERVPPVSGVSREQIRVIKTKTIFDNGRVISAAHINGYLMDAPDAWIESRSRPLCDVPPLVFGSMPNDGGFLSDWSDEDKLAVVKKYPAAEALFHRFMGATEFINNRIRWCLWLKDASPAAIRAVPPVMEAVENVQKMRAGSSRAGTRKLGETPTLFGEIRQPDSDYLIVPCHTGETRRYIPLGYVGSDVICGNANLMLPSATLYHFGVLTSSVHMAWMRAVAGRLKSDYQYSGAIVYNNFPWPKGMGGQGTEGTEETEGTRGKATAANVEAAASLKSFRSLSSLSHAPAISATAQAILDARARYPDSSLADLYDPLTMPPDLRAAHEANDRAVLAAYGLLDGRDKRDPPAAVSVAQERDPPVRSDGALAVGGRNKRDIPSESEIVAHLFGLYAKMTERQER